MIIHYGIASRPGYTPCGKWRGEVKVAYDTAKVTCNPCKEEIKKV